MKKIPLFLSCALALVLLLLVNGTANMLFKSIRLDVTEQQLFTMSDGTHNILENMTQPVEIELFFSAAASKDFTSLRSYAQRVQELLQEYVLISNGMISFKVIDPEPFSENEDRAAALGLQAIPVGVGSDSLYFGLVAKTAQDEQVLPFIQPDRETFLEYELTQLIYGLQNEQPVIGLISGLDVQGGFDYQSGRQTPPWMTLDQAEQLYQFRSLNSDIDAVDADIDLLILIQPHELTESTLYAIDQFVLRGGRLLVMLDPIAEQGGQNPMAVNAEGDLQEALNMQPLLDAWGVSFDASKALLDQDHGLVVNQGVGRPPVRHLGLLGLDSTVLQNEDVVLANLEMVNFASVGYLEKKQGALTIFDSLIASSEASAQIDANTLRDISSPIQLAQGFVPDEREYTIAARISGEALSAFPEPPNDLQSAGSSELEVAESESHIQKSDNISVVIIADTDWLTDRLWVQVQNFFGQRVASPWADNGDLFINLVDNMVGSTDLINIRARGVYSRPFDRVLELQQQAEIRFQDSENALQAQLQQTEAQLNEIQSQGVGEDGLVTLTPEQEEALANFQNQKLAIRKQLRSVQHDLNKDIDALGDQLKWLNIGFIPLLLTIWVLFSAWQKKRRHT